MNKPATLEARARRTTRVYRAAGSPTRREIRASQSAMDAGMARQGRIAEIAAEQQDEMAAARRAAAERISAALADTAAEFAALTVLAAVAAETESADETTLEDVAKDASNMKIRFRVWRSTRETRVYVQYWNGSRGRTWTDRGYYAVDEAARTFRCEADRRGPVEDFEAALAALLTR